MENEAAVQQHFDDLPSGNLRRETIREALFEE
jgi:hypothetical protein